MSLATIYNLFASTKLAIFLLSCISLGAMTGTVLPLFSHSFTYDLYNSWWFLFLLGLLSSNLIICSIDRWLIIWNQIKPGQAEITIKQLQKWPHQTRWKVTNTENFRLTELIAQLKAKGWKQQQHNHKDNSLFIFQKGKYTRLGTLLVHSSILIILAGGATGKLYGFKSYTKLPETEQINSITSKDKTKQFNLGFTVRCDKFSIERYPTGEIKNYGSHLSFIENDEVAETHEIYVNSPYKYKGIKFYQSDFEGYNDFIFSVTNKKTGNNTTLIAPFQQQVEWTNEGIRLGVINAKLEGESVTRLKLWFSATAKDPVQDWIADNSMLEIKTEQTTYEIHAKQLYATGLQVSKDPGVFLVYTGFALLLSGLLITFFMSHKRIALYSGKEEQDRFTYFSGTSNKHQKSFFKIFNRLVQSFPK